MKGVKISSDFGIVVKKVALNVKSLTRSQLFEIMDAESPFDEDEDLLSFGPHFGEEAAKEFIKRLEKAGLVYYDDFFELSEIVPQWCQLYIVNHR